MKMNFLVTFGAFLVILVIVDGRPQQFGRPGWNQNGNNGWNRNPNNGNFNNGFNQNPNNGNFNNGFNPNPNNGNFNNGFNPNPNNGNFGQISTTSTTPRTGTTVATTASPAFLACLQRCQSTMEYNPVCGSDDISYHNEGRLRCALSCGKNVATVRQGTCVAL